MTSAGSNAAGRRVSLRPGMASEMRGSSGVEGMGKRRAGGRALSLLVRAAALLSMSFAAAFGFLAAITNPQLRYNPHTFAIGTATLFGAACGIVGLLVSSLRLARRELREQRLRVEDLADRNWELKEAEERARSLLEAQGDVIVRHDREGFVTYANDAFCRLGGRAPGDLVGSPFALPVLEQGDAAQLPDGTRMHDQKIATLDGARWIAWREVVVRAGAHTRCKRRTRRHGPGRSRTRACRMPAIRRKPPTAPNRASWP